MGNEQRQMYGSEARGDRRCRANPRRHALKESAGLGADTGLSTFPSFKLARNSQATSDFKSHDIGVLTM